MSMDAASNVDRATVEGFGHEWAAFDQEALDPREHRMMFDQYFRNFPFGDLSKAEGFDLGCGSGRWALLVALQVAKLHCIDPSPKALDVSRRRLKDVKNVEFHEADAHSIPLPDESQDFGYSLGVLHHIPDPEAALYHCVAKLRPGAPLLIYLYYRFDNRPPWFRVLWRVADVARRSISRLPFFARRAVAEFIALTTYLPAARLALVAERARISVGNWPLSHYRQCSFYTMRTDSLDRFGTRIEHRFSRAEIESMMRRCHLSDIRFNSSPPFWVAVGWKRVPAASAAGTWPDR
jgi:SAM-dependent methyltransferase